MFKLFFELELLTERKDLRSFLHLKLELHSKSTGNAFLPKNIPSVPRLLLATVNLFQLVPVVRPKVEEVGGELEPHRWNQAVVAQQQYLRCN